MSNETIGKKIDAKKLTLLAMFVALSYLCVFFFRFKVQFLSFEMSDVFVTICGFVFGPLAAIGVALVKSLLEMITIADTGIYGAIMNFASSAVFAGVASVIYKYKKSFGGALAGIIVAIIVKTAAIIGLNILITPFYMKCPREVVLGLIPSLLLPFNLIKSVMNAGLVFMIYKPLSTALKSIKVLPSQTQEMSLNKKNAIVLIISTLVVVGAIITFIVCLKGNFEWMK